jgi:signal transduction histidine kinase
MRRFLLLVCFVVPLSAIAQKAPDLRKFPRQSSRLDAWTNYCDELLAGEHYLQLRTAGKKGIAMTAPNDPAHLSLYCFYIGITFDYGVETDSAACYLERSETFARKAGNERRVFEALQQLQYVYAAYGESAGRKRVIREFQQMLDTATVPTDKYNIYRILGDYYVNTGQYEKGLSYLLNGLRLRRKLLPKASGVDSTNFGVQLIGIAELYIGLNKCSLAIDYLQESKSYIRHYKDAIAHVHKDFIECYLNLNRAGKAAEEYQKLVRFLENATSIGCWTMLVESDLVFAQYYLEKKDFRNAMQAAGHARMLAPEYADDFLLAQIDHATGSIYFGLKHYEKALIYLKSAEPTTVSDDPEISSRLKLSLAETYAALEKWQQAYQYQRDYSTLQDRLLTEKSKKNVAEMEARYQNEKKQVEINQLSARNTISDLKIKNANRQRIYFLLVIAAVLAIGGLIYRQSRNRKKHNLQLQRLNDELAQANAIKARFFSIINHDLRSPVSNLIHFLHLRHHNPELLDEQSRQRLERQTISGAENLLNSMEDMLLWSKGQMDHFQPEAKTLDIRKIFSVLSNHFSAEKRVTLDIDIREEIDLHTDPDYLQTILRNLTGNAIKALENSKNPSIKWSASRQNQTVLLTISDNGPGAAQPQFRALYDETEVVGIKTGLGLHLIRDLAKAIGCRIEVETGEKGTSVVLIFES